MNKVAFAIKLNEDILTRLRNFCTSHGIKYSFFVETAVKEKLEEEENKEDLLDFKKLRYEESHAVSFEEYLRKRNV